MRNFTIKGIDFTVGDYRHRGNEFEKGLKYILLIKVYDTPAREDYFSYMDTGARFSTIRAARKYAEENACTYM
jgi:hypothetical protein